MKYHQKIFDVDKLLNILAPLQAAGKKIVFTNGCFDILHIGHTRYLQEARFAGDFLVVAVNSDESVRAIKTDKRPIVKLAERMEVLSGFSFVDFIISFDDLDPFRIIKQIQPDILIKGGDWPVDKIIGKDIVEAKGGNVYNIPEIKGNSTSNIINTILNRYQ
ncbi:MAG: D-glycero-beta-D-manno-heptose 1-phosphate adenylyltransferase [Deltaproteobacteria bacterium]|nr:D-glycero-beta-D-manno-heptose 1-phosphate adenylyltransferase [Deltaproteobacteria bacterium]MBT4526564.1 D-glycero-beta-D-manno-heptose 1-phosphate adenylyltransferase [Deltaproteobacteria bacterium]